MKILACSLVLMRACNHSKRHYNGSTSSASRPLSVTFLPSHPGNTSIHTATGDHTPHLLCCPEAKASQYLRGRCTYQTTTRWKLSLPRLFGTYICVYAQATHQSSPNVRKCICVHVCEGCILLFMHQDHYSTNASWWYIYTEYFLIIHPYRIFPDNTSIQNDTSSRLYKRNVKSP